MLDMFKVYIHILATTASLTALLFSQDSRVVTSSSLTTRPPRLSSYYCRRPGCERLCLCGGGRLAPPPSEGGLLWLATFVDNVGYLSFSLRSVRWCTLHHSATDAAD